MRIRQLLTLVVAVCLLSSGAFATLITFGEVGLTPGYGPDGAPNQSGKNPKGSVPTSIAGVDFSIDNGGFYWVADMNYVNGSPSAPVVDPFLHVVSPDTSSVGLPESSLTVTFGGGGIYGNTLSIVLSDTEWATHGVGIAAYDGLNNPLGSWLYQTGFGATGVTGIFDFGSNYGPNLTSGDIVKYIVLTDLGPDGFILDTIQGDDVPVEPGEVPEPATFGLLGSALLGLGLIARRRRS